jgi:hypothetical protein
MPLSPNYLLILSSIYERKINKIAQRHISDEYPIDRNFIDFLQLHGANENDIENWLNANKTVINELGYIRWHIPHADFIGGSVGHKNYHVFYTDDGLERINEIPIATFVGSGIIKSLLVYKYEEKPSEAHSKTIGHFGFLVKFIENVVGVRDTQKLKELTEKFIYDNRDVLNRIRSQFQTEPEILGLGMDGIAYSIGKDRILKLFQNKFAYEASVAAIERLWKQPETASTEAMIYDAGAFEPIKGKYRSINVYYYIMEKMEPASKIWGLEILIDKLQLHAELVITSKKWDMYNLNNPSLGIEIAPEIKIISEKIDKNVRNSNTKLILSIEEQAKSNNLKQNWLAKLTEEIIWKILTKRTDLHSGNLGITPNGEFRYFDPAYKNQSN